MFVCQANATLIGEIWRSEVEKRLTYRHIDMHRPAAQLPHCAQCFIHKSITIPPFHFVVRLWQTHFPCPKSLQSLLLWQCLPLQLAYHGLRPVCRHHYYGHVLIPRLHHCRQGVYESRARRDAYHDRCAKCLGHAQCHKTRRAFIRYRATFHVFCLAEVVGNRGVSRAWTHHCMAHAMSQQQRCEDIYVLLVRIHCMDCFCCCVMQYSTMMANPLAYNNAFIVCIFFSVSSHSCLSTLSFSSPPPA